MNIKNIGIIVDGYTEKESIKKWYKKSNINSPTIRYSPGNGIDFTEQTYAKQVTPTIIALLSQSIRFLVFIPDLEKREKKGRTTIQKFSLNLKNEIIKAVRCRNSNYTEVYLNNIIFVCPSNIMFENWIISDVEGIKKLKIIKPSVSQGDFDGKNGASILNKMMTIQYKKTVHGYELFKNVCSIRGSQYSPSFKSFNDTIKDLLSL